MAAANLKLVQIRVDLIRMMLLYKYGGMWMDANTFFFRDLAWVDNPAK
jgi:mannosyltransferase OCH1-like enzyme